MQESTALLFGAGIALASALAGAAALHLLDSRRERRRAALSRGHEIWSRWIDQLVAVERRAGLLLDRLTARRPLELYDPSPQEVHRELELEKGVFWRHEPLYAALDGLLEHASQVMADWDMWETPQERQRAMDELLYRHARLLEALDGLREGAVPAGPARPSGGGAAGV